MNGVLMAAGAEVLSTRADGSVKIVLGTQEISPTKMGELFALKKKVTAVYISPKETITDEELKQVDAIDVDFNTKSQAQRIRSVLYILFEQNSEGFQGFADFYKAKTEAYIEHLKTKILQK